jgi:acetolactate synthase-1/2/3 large subunit
VLREIRRTIPGTYLASGGSGLGYSGGAALGAKLANPDRTVIHLTGDGSFYFSNPSAVYEVSQRYQLPILTVIFDNGGWAAVKESVKLLYPDGAATKFNQFQALLDPPVAFEKLAEASGAYGERVSDLKDLTDAIERCVKIVKEGRSAVLSVRLSGELAAS